MDIPDKVYICDYYVTHRGKQEANRLLVILTDDYEYRIDQFIWPGDDLALEVARAHGLKLQLDPIQGLPPLHPTIDAIDEMPQCSYCSNRLGRDVYHNLDYEDDTHD